jgi:hypothetical protein
MAALVKLVAPQKTRRCDSEQMLRQQHARTPMSGKSAKCEFVRHLILLLRRMSAMRAATAA